MLIHRYNLFILFQIPLLISFINIVKINSDLTCAPDYRSQGDNYSSLNDPQDNFEYFYGYEFAHKVGGEYYDHWKGVFWDSEIFCYDAYNNISRPSQLSELEDYKIKEYNVYTNINDVQNENEYIILNHEQSNLVNFHKKMCLTQTHDISNYNHGEYELLIKMDKLLEEKYMNTPHHFYFTIENPSDDTVTFSFKVRNFVQFTEEMSTILEEWGPDPNQCLEEEVTENPNNNPDNPDNPDDGNNNNPDNPDDGNNNNDPDVPGDGNDGDDNSDAQTDKEPCERDKILLSETLLEWTEEYPIPEVFYLTDKYSIEPHKSMIVNISLTFEKDETTRGFYVISEETGKSEEPFYWPGNTDNNGKLKKLTNMEIILESDLTVGVSSFSMMRRRSSEEHSYLGENCNVLNEFNVLSGKCGDGYYCDPNLTGQCKKIQNKECKNYDPITSTCTECFLISKDGEWNPPHGKSTNLKCDLDYIDITKVKINNQKKIEVPPAIHWRVTMDFWIWISDTSILRDAGVNLNIVYKDFMAITLRCYTEGLKIYATPMEWLYEYPTYDEGSLDPNIIKKYKYQNINALLNTVDPSREVLLEDLIKNAASNWVYVRYGFNLDSSKHYLNDLPECNLKVAQIYLEQKGMPFHMKKFYGMKDMTYLYLNNFYHPLTEVQEEQGKKIFIYLRNLNIFKEYMPQNIITKYYNLHLIDTSSKFPQLLASFPFSDLTLTDSNTYTYKMKGYNYFRTSTGEVLKDEREEKEYNLVLDSNLETLRPPRNFWRLNLLNLNKQPETCDFDNYIDLICGSDETCFEDNKPFICEKGPNDKPFYLDINSIKCQQYCEYGYMHPPRYHDDNQRLYCSHQCDAYNKQCPSDDLKYTEIHPNFLCSNNFFNLYYKCFDQNEALNSADFSGIFFSSFLRTPSIYIDLKKEYTQFAIDFWYFPDVRLRYRRYIELSDVGTDYNPQSHYGNPNDATKLIFLSDCCKIMYGTLGGYNVIRFFVNEQLNSYGGRQIEQVKDSNWNHVVFSYFQLASKTYVYYLTFLNNQYYYYTNPQYDINSYDFHNYWPAPSNVILKKIIFCNKDDNVEPTGILNSQCKDAQWLDGFYRKLQIFDIKYSAKQPMFFAHQFEDDGAGSMLRHRYIYGLNSVIDNHLIDLIGGANGEVSLVYDHNYIQNPDKVNYLLYESNFAPQGGIPDWGIKCISSYSYSTFPKIRINSFSYCNTHCSICADSSSCLSCKNGYSLFDKVCKGEVNNDLNKATYFYKNPGKNMQERLSFKMNFNHIKNSPYFTFFFFIKIYGFVENATRDGPVKIMIFNQERNDNGELVDDFYLEWDPVNFESLNFCVKGQVMYTYPRFRENLFGNWIPISFTAFREDDRKFKMNMVQASILYTNMESVGDYSDTKDIFPYVKFTEFTITNKWIGLLSDIRIFNKFIANAWSIIKYKFGAIESERDDIANSEIEEIILRSDSPTSCLSSTQILNQPAYGYKIECVPDYNPFLFKSCPEGMGDLWIRSDQRPYCCSTSENSQYCYNSDYLPNKCLKSNYNGCYPSNSDHGYENQSPIWKTFYPKLTGVRNNEKIIFDYLSYIDYNRYKYVKIEEINSPQDVWAIDFWFKTSTNQAVKSITDEAKYSADSSNNNNFNEFIIEWNYHIKIRVFKEEDELNDELTYKIQCTPLVVVEHSDLNTQEICEEDKGDLHYKWTYVACGVNFPEKIFYMTTNNRLTEEKTFSSKLVLIPGDNTYLSIYENSRTGYGFTLIYQLRLWHCYNCAQAFRNLEYHRDDRNFNSVLHNFNGLGTSSSDNQVIVDQANSTIRAYMYQAADFPGYTLNFYPSAPTLCDETSYEYYNEDKDACEWHFNIARSNGDKTIYIPSSRTGRYTMDFWFFVENSAELSPGVNLFWDLHMSITILRDTSNRNTINAICFPQSYRDNADGLGGQDIITLYDKALNKDKYAFYQGSNKWNFVRCAVDQTRKLYYINDNIELELEGEILYGTTRNYRPFRYFKILPEHQLKIQNARFNPTRIFLRQIKCYRDFIDFRLMDLKYKGCAGFDNCDFYPIVFCMDYGANTRSGSYLYYNIYPETSSGMTSDYRSWQILYGDSDPYYPTFPDIYNPYFCAHGQTGGDKEPCSGSSFLCRLNSTAYFWPEYERMYIDLNTLTQVNSCPDGCRPPDGYDKKNICLMTKAPNNKYNIENCASGPNALYSSYESSFKCKPGFKKVYYECIDEQLIPNSAMYFSNIYSFPNVVFNPSISNSLSDYGNWQTESRLASYYVEIWIKFDVLNYNNIITEIEHYLYANPHEIIKDPIDQRYKYKNSLVSPGYFYPLISMNNYEWNKIIIENYYDRTTKKFNIKFYLNFEFDNPEVSILDIESIYRLHFKGFGFCDKYRMDSFCRVNDDPVYLRWGVAWYRNFRVWDADITSLQSIQAFEYGYNELITAQIYYFPLTINYIEQNYILDKINSNNRMKLNFWEYENNYRGTYDNDIRENYSTDNFDKTAIYENNYISGINEDGTDYLISSCASECKRCYSSSNTDCYECRLGYAIYGKQCKLRTGFFFKTPPENDLIEEIEMKTEKENSDFNLETRNPITITIYIKFFGINLDKINSDDSNDVNTKYYIFFCLKKAENKCKTFVGYNYNDKTIIFYVNGKERYSVKAKDYIGVWTHIGISIHRMEDKSYFPNMLNFMIDQQILIPYTDFKPNTEEVIVNIFTIYTKPICFYSSFKIFSTFYFGPYGHVNSISATRGSKLIYQINFYSSSSNSCLNNGDLLDQALNTQIISPVCVADYHPYEDINNICSDDFHFMDVIYKVSPPCELCAQNCITNCFGLDSNECTCDYYEGLYWIKTDKDFQSYECEKVDSINFAFYNSVTLNGLNVVKNDEMTLAFWLYIYEYVDNSFSSFEIIWNQHLAVTIEGNGEAGEDKYLIIKCHGDYDIDNPSMPHKILENTVKFNEWNYIVCQADKFHKLIRLNGEQDEFEPVTYTEKPLTSSLKIADKTTNFNYGFSFIRELKLYNSYNFDIWDESHYNIKNEHFKYLLHYYHNVFNEGKLYDAKIIDQVEGLVTKLNPKEDRIGYNYVIDYEKLIICEEGYVYNSDMKRCSIFDSNECIVPRTSDDKCLLCASNHPYLKEDDDLCHSDCGYYYFADSYFKQCRKCHETCYTCFAKNYTNCLSCTGEYYYIESLHICVKNCQEYGLVISNTKENTCQELVTESYITEPIYLNNSYDYNTSNPDFISKIINRNEFTKIVGHLGHISSEVKTKWVYDRDATIEINQGHKYFKLSDFPYDIYPFDITEEEELTINVRNDYFKYGYKYIFNLVIFSENGFYSTSHIHKYILMMNDYPNVGNINILPSKGYIENMFLITINNCKDDVSEKTSLKYKFTYFKKAEDVITGNNEESPNEIIIQNWSPVSEVLIKFPEVNEENKFYIRGYCQDEYELYDSEIQEVEVTDAFTFINDKVPVEELLETIDLEEELTSTQLLKRAEFLATTTVDFEKGIEILNRTNITTYNNKGILQVNLTNKDPKSSLPIEDIYCNNRGVSYVIYFYLICDCPNFEGSMCQIDHSSYNYVVNIYKELFTKIKRMQTTKYDKNLIRGLNLIMKSAATFMDVEHKDFMLEAIDFINLYTNRFKDKMLEGNNYETYFDIYNSLIEYGLSIVNKLKYRNFITKNTKNAAGFYNNMKFRYATIGKGEGDIVLDYFNKVKVSLQNLMEFYVANKKEVRFINKNINVYVSLIDENFAFDSYYNIEKKLYEPYMNFQRCLERTMIQIQRNPSYRVYLSSIVWKVSPYMSSENLYMNTSSPLFTFKFLDYYTGEKLYLSNCGTPENQIEIFFPVNNFDLVRTINERRAILSPENQYNLNDDIFCDPVYINKSGAVFDIPIEERRQKYFLGFNFSCNYYDVKTEDKSKIKMIKDTLDYHKYTKENYIQCLSNKLMQNEYSEFVVDFYTIPYEFHLNSRYFYLKHYKLFSWKDNYKNNQAFYYFLISSILCVGLSLIYIYFEKYNFIRMQRLSELKKEITKLNLPYRDEYLFNNDLMIQDEIKTKFKDKRKPDLEEMNLDTNNIDINIMADKIARYNKGFKKKENALDFNTEFFGIKQKEKFDVNTKFFNNETHNSVKVYNNEDISPEHLQKMKKFYQTGFTGLNSKENTKKELQISPDKKRIIINRAYDDLEKISEKEEEGPFNLELNEKDFFNKEEESNKEEKSTTFKRNSKNRKYKKELERYKNYAATNEQSDRLDTESQLKSSRRETATKKFFNPNPPKKENNSIKNSLVFSKKDQQKIAKSNSAFFGNTININSINNKKSENKKKKEEKNGNLFQEEYKLNDIYKPDFKKPKVISENLGFYNLNEKDFEQEKDNDNLNPPYFGKRLKNNKYLSNDKEDDTNAEMRFGFYFKNRQIDLTNDEEKMPQLQENLTFENKMEEFHEFSISFKYFLIHNIKSRHILLTFFDRMSIVYDRYMRAGNFLAQLSMYAFFLSLFFINDEKQEAYASGNRKQYANLFLYCFISDILGCIVAHLPAYFFWVNDKKFRQLYCTIKNDGGIYSLKQMEDVIKKGRFFWNLLGIITQIMYIFIGFYFAFGFCATYSYQSSTFCLGLILTCLIDFIVTEIVWEIIIGLLFYIRDYGRLIVFFGTLFNTLRNIKHLI